MAIYIEGYQHSVVDRADWEDRSGPHSCVGHWLLKVLRHDYGFRCDIGLYVNVAGSMRTRQVRQA